MKKRLCCGFFFVCVAGFAALPASTVFEVNQAGSDTNGNCFVTGASGTDHTYPTPTVISYTDLVAVTANTITSAAHAFGATDVGNCIRINSGTGWTTGVYYIVSVSVVTATVDRSIAVMGSTGGTGKQGGAGGTLSQLNSDMCSGCIAYVKSDGTYVVTSKLTWNYGNSASTQVNGYSSTRGDNGKYTIQAGVNLGDRVIDLNMSNNSWIRNFIIDVNSFAGTSCMLFLGAEEVAENMECENATGGNVITFNNVRNICRYCYIHDSSTSGTDFLMFQAESACIYCVANNNGSAHAFDISQGRCYWCVVSNQTAGSSDAFFISSGQGPIDINHCVVYNVPRDAFRLNTQGAQMVIQNCVISTAGTAFENTTGTAFRAGDVDEDYNFLFNNTTNYTSIAAGAHDVILSADPFTNASTRTFTLNSTAGGGAAVKQAGTPAAIPGVTGSGFPSGGVLDPAGGGGGGGGTISAVFP